MLGEGNNSSVVLPQSTLDMRKQLPQAFAILLFIALLCVPMLIKNQQAASMMPTARGANSGAANRYSFAFVEAAQAAGIKWQHIAPTLDHKLDHIMPQVASMGAGVAVCDFDRDGRLDFYATNSGEGSTNSLFRNLGNGRFEDVAAKMGVGDVNRMPDGVSMGAVWADYDNDGWDDLLIYKWGRPELFHNLKGKGFARVTEKAGLPPWVNANTATWLDFDNDGKLDIFIAGYYRENVNLWKLTTTRIMPDSLEYAGNGARKWLLRGHGDGTFEDVTNQAGLGKSGWALACVAADLRGTGFPDLVVANDYGYTEYWANEGGKFHEIGGPNGVGYRPKSGMSASTGDILNAGDPAIYITNISESGNLVQGNNLWLPSSDDAKTKNRGVAKYLNVASTFGVEMGGWSFGAQFGDLNNDGNLDLYLTNGYISADKSANYWYDYSKISGGNSAIISDAANWPPMKGRSLSGYQSKRVWLNDGNGRFNDVALQTGVTDQLDGRAVALADFSNGGALDAIVSNQRGPLLFYRNTVDAKNRWIEVELEGKKSNRNALGAIVTCFWDGKKQRQDVQSAAGFCAQNMRRLHFGLGHSTKIERLEIHWPSGKTQTLTNLATNKLHHIIEAS